LKSVTRVIPFTDLSNADLVVDAVYESSIDGQLSGEPITRLLPGSGNMGGFRVSGRGDKKNSIVLYTTGEDRDWPDTLDVNTGQFVYYGDNKTPGHEIHDTPAGGNRILRSVFERLHDPQAPRVGVAPFLIFRKFPMASCARSVQFKGLATPGFPGLSATEELVAVWKASKGQRFQNYRSVFTILDIPVVSRSWITDLAAGISISVNAPSAWREWVTTGKYKALTAESTTIIRDAEQQTPDTPLKAAILEQVWQHFREEPIAFEAFAARVYQMIDQRVIIDEITRGAIDGGRDAVGRYLLGLIDDTLCTQSFPWRQSATARQSMATRRILLGSRKSLG
jgi:Restriction endonuclease AspBHI N-terminal